MPHRRDEVLELFLTKLRQRLGVHLKRVILFGSRARGDNDPTSDYDCLVILDEVSSSTKDTIDEVAGELLYEYNVVFSVFPISEEKHQKQKYSPLLMNVNEEGIVL